VENALLVPVGVAIASFASLIGIGGGLLWAPYLILVRGIEPHTAIMMSFFIQSVGMGSATFTNMRNRAIYWRMAVYLLPFIACGVIAGSFINQRIIRKEALEAGLGVVCVVISLLFVFQTEDYDAALNLDRSIVPPAAVRAQSSFFGLISGRFSIGFGDFLIPFLRGRMKIPMTFTIGTCLFLNFVISLVGGTAHIVLTRDTVNGDTLVILGYCWAGVIIGGQLGPRISRMIDDNRLKEIFVFAMLMIGIHLIYQSM